MSSDSKKHKFETNTVRAGEKASPGEGAHTTPIYATSTFVFKNADEGAARFADFVSGTANEGFIYTRLGNPTTRAFEIKMATLENGEDALAFSSGMAAISSTLLSLVGKGDHIIACKAIYGCTHHLLAEVLSKFGVETTFVDTDKLEEVRKAIKENTKVIFYETPTNPTMLLTDIKEISKICKEKNIVSVVDNTFESPYFQKPLDLGADIVIHSCTKYIGGHGDLIAGVVISNKERITNIKPILTTFGGVLSPFDAFLLLRGLKTLSVRMKRHQKNALIIAKHLKSHPLVENVRYPGLVDHPHHELAMKQMTGNSGVMTFEVKGGVTAGKKLIDSVELCTLAVSLGCTDTLIQHPASMTHAVIPKEKREKAGITDRMVRLSVGLEDPEDIINDLDQALAQAKLLKVEST